MKNEIVIAANSISKKFRLFKSRNDRIKEAINLGKRKYHQEYWALNDVSFKINKGHTIGIIGRNGSGKSTLLQIIAAVTQATTGSISVNGRIAALLELGAGFNPLFTGRENAILSGVIQGVSEEKMLEIMSDIELFADIGNFFDQPVGTYSSGMLVRLAFAAAINIKPDILILDEALGVGDISFQEKCYAKIQELQQQDVTILIVSHSTVIIERLCSQAIVLDMGKLMYKGDPSGAIDYYDALLFPRKNEFNNKINVDQENNTTNIHAEDLSNLPKKRAIDKFINASIVNDNCKSRRSYNQNEIRFGEGGGEIIDYLLVAEDEVDPKIIKSGDKVELYVKIRANEKMNSPSIGLGLFTIDGVMICAANTWGKKIRLQSFTPGNIKVYKLSFECLLTKGDYFIHIGLTQNSTTKKIHHDMRRSIAYIKVESPAYMEGLCNLNLDINEIGCTI